MGIWSIDKGKGMGDFSLVVRVKVAGMPAKCGHCKGTRFWRGPSGQWLCCRCRPMPMVQNGQDLRQQQAK